MMDEEFAVYIPLIITALFLAVLFWSDVIFHHFKVIL